MLTESEKNLLIAACRQLPIGESLREEDDYDINIISMSLDFQLRDVVVKPAFAYFREHHRVNEHHELPVIAEGFDNSKEGNIKLSNALWNNNLWTRAEFLRMLLKNFRERGVHSQTTLKRWVQAATFESDVKGQFKTEYHSIGYTMFQYLRLRLGHETIKPDGRVLKFIEDVIGRKVRPVEAVASLEFAARQLQRSARELDAAIYRPRGA